ncbi:hypothetical protein OOK31_00745 [Streptomyces sp. NBC_00249]|uniref:hypothetical protein n=1 Tax=Streptomyces sp. NBC_00249 TaxID=2975690 RepID=UPI00224DE930|nr:hypothetical protein [Streptomyces sp. NBC_00249]MCX5192427.1 hypothetical protein [Streptomyces sp. NBC_00249]
MSGKQGKKQQPGQSGKTPEEMGTERGRPTGPDRARPQQPEKPSSSGGDDKSKRRREVDPLREGTIGGDEL